ncbi:MAG: hypothetical protein ACI9BD_000762, partial [Candidatus Marinamargulisbacteria bacterium]
YIEYISGLDPTLLKPAAQVRVYAVDDHLWDPVSGLKISLGARTQSATTLLGPIPPGVHIDGTLGSPATGQDQLVAKVNVAGKTMREVTDITMAALDSMDTGALKTNVRLLKAVLGSEDYQEWTVQRFGQELTSSTFVNEAHRPTFPEHVHSALTALALTIEHGLKILRPGALFSPARVIPDLPSVSYDSPPLEAHFGQIFEGVQASEPTLSIVEQRKLATTEFCRQIQARYAPGQDTVGFICTRRRDTAQSKRKNNFPEELFAPYEQYHDRQPYLAIETTMGGNDQAKRGGELKSENAQFGDRRSKTHFEAGLCRGEIQVKLGDKAASPEERLAYIREKGQENGPMLVEVFSPWHSVDDWANEAQLWAQEGHALVVYPPEHAEEMSATQIWSDFVKPCLEKAREGGFLDQVAFMAIKDTGSATKAGRAQCELSQLPKLAAEDGFGSIPWGHHTHDIGQGVHVSSVLATNGFGVFWVSPDNHAGMGANVPESALHGALTDLGLQVDFDPGLAQRVSPLDEYAMVLGAPYSAPHGQTSTSIIDAYLAPGALSHSWGALSESFPRASDQEMIQIKENFVHAHRILFKDIFLLPPLTPHPNKLSNTAIELLKLADKAGVRFGAGDTDEFVAFVAENLPKLPEAVKYFSGMHYPKWAQYDKVAERFPELVSSAQRIYRDLNLSNVDMPWTEKLTATSEELLGAGIFYDPSTLVDTAYHGSAMPLTLSEHGLTAESMFMLREGDLQRLAQSEPGKTATLMTPNGTIPVEFLGSKRTGKSVEFVVQMFGPSGPIKKVTVKSNQPLAMGSQGPSLFGMQKDGYRVSEGKKGELVEWYMPHGIVFPGEHLGLKNENKSIAPITAEEMVIFKPLVADTVSDKRVRILAPGTHVASFEPVTLSRDIQSALSAIHGLRTCSAQSLVEIGEIPSEFLAEALAHYPVRTVRAEDKAAVLKHLSEHGSLPEVESMFDRQLKTP